MTMAMTPAARPPLRATSARAQWVNFRTVATVLGVDVEEAEVDALVLANARPDLDDAEVLLMALAQVANSR